ncbi:unnamed protein product [Discosporangium mesarthrocarpum]
MSSERPLPSMFREVIPHEFGSGGHTRKVNAMGWNKDGRFASAANEVKLWDVDAHGNARWSSTLENTSHSTQDLAWDPTSSHTLALCSQDKELHVYDVRGNKPVQEYVSDGENINVAWSPNGQYIAMGTMRSSPQGTPIDVMGIYDVRHAKKRLKTVRFFYAINDFIWSPNGEVLITGTGDGHIELIRVSGFKNGAGTKMTRFKRIAAHTVACFSVAMAPRESRYMAVGSADALVSLWDVDNLVCVRTLPRLETSVRSVSFSHNDHYLASGSEDHVIDIAEVETGECAHQINVGNRSTSALAWHPKELLLASASGKDLALWRFKEHAV